jgi:hypothetical protein
MCARDFVCVQGSAGLIGKFCFRQPMGGEQSIGLKGSTASKWKPVTEESVKRTRIDSKWEDEQDDGSSISKGKKQKIDSKWDDDDDEEAAKPKSKWKPVG